jgi:hypothetical protein
VDGTPLRSPRQEEVTPPRSRATRATRPNEQVSRGRAASAR